MSIRIVYYIHTHSLARLLCLELHPTSVHSHVRFVSRRRTSTVLSGASLGVGSVFCVPSLTGLEPVSVGIWWLMEVSGADCPNNVYSVSSTKVPSQRLTRQWSRRTQSRAEGGRQGRSGYRLCQIRSVRHSEARSEGTWLSHPFCFRATFDA